MKIFFRWMTFTLALAAIGLGLAFGLLFLGRLYPGLSETAVVLSTLTLFSIGATVAAINFGSKLADEETREIEAGGSLKVPTRAIVEGDDTDAR